MNDPGLDGPISNDANDVENRQRDERDETKDDEDAFLEPRYVGGKILQIPLPTADFINK